MAWVVGLTDDMEIKAMRKAGYEVRTDLNLGDLQPVLDGDDDGRMAAVFVDCDISELLLMEKEGV